MGVYAVTGGSNGIGAKTISILKQKGHETINIDWKRGDIEADLSLPEGRQKAIDELFSLCPQGLDGLILCAGIPGSRKDLRLILSVNYFGTISIIKGAYDLLKQKNGACVISASSAISREDTELAPAANPGAPVIPQLLAKDGELAAWMIGELRGLGYTEVNLNLGCPSGTVTAKGKGSGMLRDPVKLDAFLAAVFANAEGPISVKTRLGVEKPEEFAAILDIYNRYPICELTIHPRVMRQLYRGQADRAAFAAALPGCRMPVCYNGDVTTAADLHTLEAQYPQLSGIMVGRGIIADPALFREARGGAPAAREELRGYLDDLYHGYSELFGSAGCAVSRMKGHWFYLIHKFEGAEKLEKQLRKVREPWEYEVVVNQIFTLPFRP